MKKAVFGFGMVCWLMLAGHSLYATHNRAGEITYEQIGELTYRITVITYTATGPGPVADRPRLEVQFGDGTAYQVNRIEEVFLPDFYKRNKYVWEHTYPGPGTYQIVVEDPNRNEGVRNIPNSVNVVFSIKTILIINPEVGYNSTPVLLNPPIDKAARGYTFIHNPAAFDPDGDSLSYKLAVCTAEDGREIEGYTFPAFTDSLTVDELTGDLIWAAPADTGKYNIAMTIEEWRNGVQIGRIQRDMQIEVYVTDNQPPRIEGTATFCVLANDFLSAEISARDPDNDSIALTASGGPLSLDENPAVFRQVLSVPGTAKAIFEWETNCQAVRLRPYQVVVKAKDKNADLELIDSKNLEVFVHAPAPQMLEPTPGSASIQLNWEACPCSNNTGYRIYRKTGSASFDPGPCEVGVPEELGYQLIASVGTSGELTYSDNNAGRGLQQETDYCYRVTAVFADGAESFASNEVCARLVKGAPQIIRVSVDDTHPESGQITIDWMEPASDVLTGLNGPFRYRIYRSEGMFGQNPVLLDSLDGLSNTRYVDHGLDTENKQWSYQVELINADPLNYAPVDAPQVASTVFLTLEPHHNSMRLRFQNNVPWEVRQYGIYQMRGNQADSLGLSENQSYTVAGLEDGSSYCFSVVAFGYPDGYPDVPVSNLSQIACGIPMDTLAPCPPVLTGESVCDSLANHLNWQPAHDSCSSDIAFYKVYYRTTLDGDMALLDSVPDPYTLEFWHFPEESMAACYVVTAVDSVGNESANSNVVCLDECINYVLPNVFTPNGDGKNDLLKPLPYNLVESVDLKVFSRWGNIVFETRDPDINWDGTHYVTGQKVSSGVYYYVCDVYERRLTGLEPRYIVGFIHVLYSKEDHD